MSILQDDIQSLNLFSIYQFMATEKNHKQKISLFEPQLGDIKHYKYSRSEHICALPQKYRIRNLQTHKNAVQDLRWGPKLEKWGLSVHRRQARI